MVKLPAFPPLTLSRATGSARTSSRSAGFGERRGSKGKVVITPSRPKDDERSLSRPRPRWSLPTHTCKGQRGGGQGRRSWAFGPKSMTSSNPAVERQGIEEDDDDRSVHPRSLAKDGWLLGLVYHCKWD